MWYQTYYEADVTLAAGTEEATPLRDARFRYGVGYAESEDGVHFDRPLLGRVQYKGQDTNLAVRGYFSPSPAKCIYDADEPNPAKRYRLWVWDEAPYPGRHSLIGMSLYVSTDGFDWKGYEWADEWCNDPQPYCYVKQVGQFRYPYNIGPNETSGIYWDAKIGKFVNYCRANNGSVRCIGRIESPDGIHWTPAVMVATPDLRDPFMFQFYAAHPYRSGEFIILYVMTYAPAQAGHHCKVEVLASRDGFHFTRVGDRQPWIDNGPAGSWNGGMLGASAPVLHDDKLWIYVSGHAEGHDAATTHGAVGLYHFRPDGYVSFDAGPGGGGLATRKMVWTHDHIHVNAEAPDGEVAVEILPAEKARRFGHQPTLYADYYPPAIDGFGRADCAAFGGDSTRAELTFRGASLSDLKGRYVQLRFHLTNAKLYSWSVS